MQDVAFVRSPIAHGKIRAIEKPIDAEHSVFLASDLHGVLAYHCRLWLSRF
jgi:carbon-monoxide dehydrogenase large subunit